MHADRPSRGRAWLGGTIAISLGVAAWLLHRGPAAPAPLAVCPTILDTVATFGARLMPGVPFGVWVVRANTLLLVAAVACVFLLLGAVTPRLKPWPASARGTWPIAIATSLLVIAQPALDPMLAPFAPAPLLVAAATWLALVAATDRDRAARGAWLATAGIGALATALVTRRVGTIAIAWLTPGLPPAVDPATQISCTLPPVTTAAALTWTRDVLAVATSAGPYAFGLAALGAFVLGSGLKTRTLILLAYAVLPAAAGAGAGDDLTRGMAPLLVALWMCVAIGLNEVVRACHSGIGGRVAATALVLFLPLFQVPRLLARVPPDTTFGLERLSLRDLRQLLFVLPDRSALVSEDASTAILLRGLDGTWQETGKRLGLVSRDPGALSAIIARGEIRVFALPLAQTSLQWLGFALVDAPLPGISGLATVEQSGQCQRVKSRWMNVDLSHTKTVSMIVAERGEDETLVFYAASDQAPALKKLDWPPTAVGLNERTFARERLDHRAALAEEMAMDELPSDHAIVSAPFVTRLRLWRGAGAPTRLALDLGVRPIAAAARLISDTTPHGVLVCPAFPHTAAPVVVTR